MKIYQQRRFSWIQSDNSVGRNSFDIFMKCHSCFKYPGTGSYFFAAHDKNIDVLTYGDKNAKETRLELFHHVSWGQAEAEDMEETTIVRELDLYARFINVQDDLLFIAHFRFAAIPLLQFSRGFFPSRKGGGN